MVIFQFVNFFSEGFYFNMNFSETKNIMFEMIWYFEAYEIRYTFPSFINFSKNFISK